MLIVKLADEKASCSDRRLRFILRCCDFFGRRTHGATRSLSSHRLADALVMRLSPAAAFLLASLVTGACEFVVGLFIWERVRVVSFSHTSPRQQPHPALSSRPGARAATPHVEIPRCLSRSARRRLRGSLSRPRFPASHRTRPRWPARRATPSQSRCSKARGPRWRERARRRRAARAGGAGAGRGGAGGGRAGRGPGRHCPRRLPWVGPGRPRPGGRGTRGSPRRGAPRAGATTTRRAASARSLVLPPLSGLRNSERLSALPLRVSPPATQQAEDDSFRSAQSELSAPSLSSSAGAAGSPFVLRPLTPMHQSPPATPAPLGSSGPAMPQQQRQQERGAASSGAGGGAGLEATL